MRGLRAKGFDLRNRKAMLLTLRPVPFIPIEPTDPQIHHSANYTNVYTFVKAGLNCAKLQKAKIVGNIRTEKTLTMLFEQARKEAAPEPDAEEST